MEVEGKGAQTIKIELAEHRVCIISGGEGNRTMSKGHKLGSKIGGVVLPNIGNKIWIGDDDHMEEADTRIKYSVLLEEKLKAAQRNAAKLRAVSRMVMVTNSLKSLPLCSSFYSSF